MGKGASRKVGNKALYEAQKNADKGKDDALDIMKAAVASMSYMPIVERKSDLPVDPLKIKLAEHIPDVDYSKFEKVQKEIEEKERLELEKKMKEQKEKEEKQEVEEANKEETTDDTDYVKKAQEFDKVVRMRNIEALERREEEKNVRVLSQDDEKEAGEENDEGIKSYDGNSYWFGVQLKHCQPDHTLYPVLKEIYRILMDKEVFGYNNYAMLYNYITTMLKHAWQNRYNESEIEKGKLVWNRDKTKFCMNTGLLESSANYINLIVTDSDDESVFSSMYQCELVYDNITYRINDFDIEKAKNVKPIAVVEGIVNNVFKSDVIFDYCDTPRMTWSHMFIERGNRLSDSVNGLSFSGKLDLTCREIKKQIRIAETNHNWIAPCVMFKNGEIKESYLIPIWNDGDITRDEPDFVVICIVEDNRLIAKTVITPELAYALNRVCGKVECGWLNNVARKYAYKSRV